MKRMRCISFLCGLWLLVSSLVAVATGKPTKTQTQMQGLTRAQTQTNSNIVDGIIAVVNDEIITLSDLKIVTAFAIYADDMSTQTGETSQFILEKLINQKLITQMTKENILIEDIEVEQAYQVIQDKMGEDRLNRQLVELDLVPADLYVYIRAKLFYDQIIALKFKRETRVTLKDMETYYNEVYLPRKASQGEEPQSMMEILNEIESAIKEEKALKQVKDWLMNMRREADIQIYTERIVI